jgi:hypothetical protein
MREVDQDEMRQFLLGRLDEARRQRVEGLFLADPKYRQELLMAENDLIEDYLEGALSKVDEEQLRAHFLSTPQQRLKLKVAKSIKKYVAVELATHSLPGEVAVAQTPKGRRNFNVLALRNPFIYLPLAAALLIAVAFGANWLVEYQRLNAQRAQEQSRHAALTQELAQLNDPANSRRETAGNQGAEAVLPPVSTRGTGGPPRLSPPADATVLTLRLALTGNEYQNYRAVLQKVGSAETFTLPPLHAENTPDGKAVQVKIPVQLLPHGLYRLELDGITADGKVGATAEYSFSLANSKTP